MRVLVIGLTRELPLSPADAMDIADVLVARAANAHTEGTYACMYCIVDICGVVCMHLWWGARVSIYVVVGCVCVHSVVRMFLW